MKLKWWIWEKAKIIQFGYLKGKAKLNCTKKKKKNSDNIRNLLAIGEKNAPSLLAFACGIKQYLFVSYFQSIQTDAYRLFSLSS